MIARRWLALIGALMVLPGCSLIELNRLMSPLEREGASKLIAVVPSRYAPRSNFATFARSYPDPEGVAVSAGGGAAKGAGLGVQAGLQSPYTVVLTPFFVAIGAVIGGITGAVNGAMAVVPAGQADAIDPVLNSATVGIRLSELTAEAVVTAESKFGPYRTELLADIGPTSNTEEPDYRPLAARGFGGVIEVRTIAVGLTSSGGRDPELALFLTVEARLIDVETGRATWFRGLGYETPRRKASAWAEDNASLLKREIARAISTLGERIVESLILSADVITGYRNDTIPPSACGLSPTNPLPQWLGAVLRPKTTKTVLVDSHSPRLAWTAADVAKGYFQKAEQLSSPQAPARPIDVSDIQYDLRIWRLVDGGSLDMVYERIGLGKTEHLLEKPLEPNTEYVWSVRPRFFINGHPRALRWSAAINPDFAASDQLVEDVFYAELDGGKPKKRYCSVGPEPRSNRIYALWSPCHCLDYIPPENGYRFRTP